jgi:thymidylate kinase
MNIEMQVIDKSIIEQVTKHSTFLISSRDTIQENHKNYLEPNDKVIIKDLEANFRQQLKEMQHRHQQEIYDLKVKLLFYVRLTIVIFKQNLFIQRKYKDLRLKFEKEKRKQHQKAAKSYQSAKKIYQKRIQELDTTSQKQIRDMITTINICGDKNTHEYVAIDSRYKLCMCIM